MKKQAKYQLRASLLLASSLILAPISQVAAQAGLNVHTVESGEWLWKIAREHGVTPGDIMAENSLTSEDIVPGMTLVIPAPGAGVTVEPPVYEDQTGAPSGSHIVQSGDTIYDLARIYGLTVDQIMAWNGLSSSWIDVGDELILYGDPAAVPSGPVEGTPTTPVPSPTYGGSYQIQPGDTLSDIALAYGISVGELMAANGLANSWIIAGDYLTVPASGTVYVPTPPVTNTTPWVDPSTSDGYYTVQSGDTLSGIAYAFGLSLEDLRAMNNLYTDWLDVGDQIYVGGDYTEPAYVPTTTESTETETEIETKPNNDNGESNTTSRPPQTFSLDMEITTGTAAGDQANGLQMMISELPVTARPSMHRVAKDETLNTIATKYQTTVANLRRWNALKDDENVKENQELFVTNPLLIPIVYEVQEADTIDSIAEQFGTTPELIRKWNKLQEADNFKPWDLAVVSNPRPKIHEVKPGETLEVVAELYEVTVEEIREWNGIPERVMIVNGSLVVSDPKADSEEVATDPEAAASTEAAETSEESSSEAEEADAE